jgi:4,5-DOPA dioxygenase extradiol
LHNLMPALFLGHGNPMYAVSKNGYAEAWAAIGRSLPHPTSVLAISAHWYIPYCAVTANLHPPTIHDFGGFPQELYQVRYPAPGNLELAGQVRDLLAPVPVQLNEDWGLDHGTWSVLRHVFPAADIPVVQLSIDATQPPLYHYELGQRLHSLRQEGVLVIGSGNIVHNLRAYAWAEPVISAYDWAVRFEENACKAILDGDHSRLINYPAFGNDANLAVPTPDHYLPLLYILGLCGEQESVSFPVQGVDGGSVSMLAVQIG